MRTSVVCIVLGASLVACSPGEHEARGPRPERHETARKPRSADVCDVPPRILERVRRGFVRGRSGDVVMVEDAPNQLGTIHSTPWEFTQRIPLVFYGPGHVNAGVRLDEPVTLADVAPTYARLLGFDAFPERDGSVLDGALRRSPTAPPALVLTVVWDGGGTNVLRRWPDAWPNLKSLSKRGTSYTNATVGSSPSVTPAVHATLGTGFFPEEHGLPDVKMRLGAQIVDPWPDGSPRLLERRALADLWDAETGDRAEVALLAHDFWHAGMIGHGSQIEGDKDIAVLDDLETATSLTTNDDFYTLPGYLDATDGLGEAITEVDGRDGRVDGMWLGNPLNPQDGLIRAMPPWNVVQTDMILEIVEREGFGTDEIPDLFFTNYKSTDLAGHAWNMEEPEVRDNLEQQDAELGRLVDELDRLVGEDRYVLVLTADHGMAPYPEVRGGWAIDMPEVTRDLNRAFAPDGEEVVLANRGFQVFLDRDLLAEAGYSPADVAAYLRDYALRDNATDQTARNLPAGDEDHPVFLAALTPDDMAAAAECGG